MVDKKEKSKAVITEEDLEASFVAWKNTLDKIAENADKGYMPLLANLFRYGQEILELYHQSYINTYRKNNKKE